MTRVFLFRNLVNPNQKGVNYHRKDDSSSNFMSVKKTSSLDNLFTFKDSKKSLKKTPLGFLFAISGFNEPKKKQNLTQNFGTGFKEHNQNVEISA